MARSKRRLEEILEKRTSHWKASKATARSVDLDEQLNLNPAGRKTARITGVLWQVRTFPPPLLHETDMAKNKLAPKIEYSSKAAISTAVRELQPQTETHPFLSLRPPKPAYHPPWPNKNKKTTSAFAIGQTRCRDALSYTIINTGSLFA